MSLFGEEHYRISPRGLCHAFGFNRFGRDFVVGDIHGQYRLLREAMDEVGFSAERDRLFLVGDLIDRGPESMKCLALAYQRWAFSVMGNHEQLMFAGMMEFKVQGYQSEAYQAWMANGGQWILNEDPGELRVLAMDIARRLPMAMQLTAADGRQVGIIHAGVTSGKWGHFDREADVWTRRVMSHNNDLFVPEDTVVDGIDAVVVGHCIRRGVTVRGNQVGMDVGAARGYRPVLWTLDQVLDAVDDHLVSGNVSTEYVSPSPALMSGA